MMLTVCFFSLGGCSVESSTALPAGELRISGSTSMTPLLEDLATGFVAVHPGVEVQVLGGGSEVGLAERQAGSAELAAVSWLAPEGASQLGPQPHAVALDALVLIVHPANRTSSLTFLQARALFRGEVLDWTSYGGPEAEPVIVSREEGSGSRKAFEEVVMGGDRVTLNALVLPNSAAVVEYVAIHPNAVGYVSSIYVNDRVKALAIEGVFPSYEHLRSGAYPIIRTLYLVTPSTEGAAAAAFRSYVVGVEGQAIVARRCIPLR